jgi:hypothetical protein
MFFFITDLIACSACFGHHYAHHQELESIIQLFAAYGLCCLVFKLCVPDTQPLGSTQYRQLENQAPKTTGGNQLYNTLELLMMGIMVPETCWGSNKICNKKNLLHLVGNLFPHINNKFIYVPVSWQPYLCYVVECGVIWRQISSP